MASLSLSTLSVDDISVQSAILSRTWVAIVFDFLDKPNTKPINSHNWIDVFYYDNLFILSFDTEEKREEYKKAYEDITWTPNWFIPRIGNFFERNDKYYLVGDYDDTKLADVTDTTQTNWVLYRWVVINPVIFWEEQRTRSRVNGGISQ